MISKKDIETRLDMIFEEKRLKSYKKWPYSDNDLCSIKKMAQAGFFWTGTNDEPDAAQCFVCNKSLDGWEAKYDPWSEHKKHSSSCPFVVTGKKEDDITLKQFVDLWRAMVRNVLNSAVVEYEKMYLEKVQLIREEFNK